MHSNVEKDYKRDPFQVGYTFHTFQQNNFQKWFSTITKSSKLLENNSVNISDLVITKGVVTHRKYNRIQYICTMTNMHVPI